MGASTTAGAFGSHAACTWEHLQQQVHWVLMLLVHESIYNSRCIYNSRGSPQWGSSRGQQRYGGGERGAAQRSSIAEQAGEWFGV
eukprot:511213-Pelagomonas_calceolata.AAC.5